MSVSLSSAAFVRELVYRKSAIVLEESQHYLIESRLEPIATEAGFQNIDLLVAAARGGETSLQALVVDALTTNETSFFRDVTPFDALEKEVLPKLIAARSHIRALRFWCAACSRRLPTAKC